MNDILFSLRQIEATLTVLKPTRQYPVWGMAGGTAAEAHAQYQWDREFPHGYKVYQALEGVAALIKIEEARAAETPVAYITAEMSPFPLPVAFSVDVASLPVGTNLYVRKDVA